MILFVYGLVALGTLANGPLTLVEDCSTKVGLVQLSTIPTALITGFLRNTSEPLMFLAHRG